MTIVLWASFACAPAPSPDPSGATGSGPLWTLPVPVLDVEDPTQGQTSSLQVTGAPAGAKVTVWRGASEGQGPCAAPGQCLGLVEPEVVAEGTVDAAGIWSASIRTADDMPARGYLFQAEVLDDIEGWVSTDAVLRTVSIPPERSSVSFSVHGAVGFRGVGNTHTGGVAWIDYDGDFWPDLFVTNGAGGHHGLFRNEGDGTFTDLSHLVVKPDPTLEDAGVVFGDIDNDGDSDLIVAVDAAPPMTFDVPQQFEGGPNLVYLNNGDGTFTEAAAALGLVDPRGWRTSALALADVDRDGFLDVWLGNWAMSRLPAGDNVDLLMMNQGGRSFVPHPGFDLHGRDALHGMFFDVDRDLWPDLYVGNVSHVQEPPDYDADDQLYWNVDGVLAEAPERLAPGWGDEAWGAMGSDVGDIDNDGDWDLYVTNVWLPTPTPRGNPLYVGGAGTLSDNVCDVAGVCAGHKSWPTSFADFDRDGWVDLFVGTSTPEAPDLLFVNNRDGTFSSHRVPVFRGNTCRGGSYADFDGDGDLDLFLWRLFQPGLVLRNDGRDDNHWIEIKLIGTESNTDAIGAELALQAPGGPPQLRRVSGGDSAHSQQDLVVHFGLGQQTRADVTVRWPSGRQDVLTGLDADRFHLVVEGQGVVPEAIEARAVWDPQDRTLEVRATSTLRGRSRVSVTGLGTLPWRTTERQYRERFPLETPPQQVVVQTDWGASVEVETDASG